MAPFVRPRKQPFRAGRARMCAVKGVIFCLFLGLASVGCEDLSQRHKEQPRVEPSSPTTTLTSAAASDEKRFILPTKSKPFPESSVALDTITGRLCKTYAWEDNVRLPKGLPLCSEWNAVSPNALTFPITAYRGFTYAFNGTRWVKGPKAQKYNPKTHSMEPWSDDQYDPLGLFPSELKAKRTLTEEEIRKVAEQFQVSYEEATEEAKQRGYHVPSKH